MNWKKGIRLFFKYQPFQTMALFITQNASPDSFRYKIAPTPDFYKEDDCRIVNRNAIKLKLRLNDLVDWYSFWGFRDEGIEFLLSKIKKGDYIIDIGTNKGIVALKMLKETGSGGFVLGFEPNRLTYDRCVENIELNRLENIEILNNGLGDKQEVLFIDEPYKNNSGGNFLTSSRNGNAVQVLTLDNVVKEKSITNIDLIKIDVEGFELNVLKGAEQTIKKHKPLLFIELINSNLIRNQTSASEVVAFIDSLGYQIINVLDGSVIYTNTNVSTASYDIFCGPVKNS